MDNKAIILLIILILGVIGISGCTDPSNTNSHNFSDKSISFNFPEGFENGQTAPINPGSSNWNTLSQKYNSDGTGIAVSKNSKMNNPEKARTNDDTPNEYVSHDVLLHTKETNPSGIVIFKSIKTVQDPDDTTKKITYINYYFKDKQGAVYCISVYDYESNYQKVSEIADEIFNSLKLN